jgi:hypothetical protein
MVESIVRLVSSIFAVSAHTAEMGALLGGLLGDFTCFRLLEK